MERGWGDASIIAIPRMQASDPVLVQKTSVSQISFPQLFTFGSSNAGMKGLSHASDAYQA